MPEAVNDPNAEPLITAVDPVPAGESEQRPGWHGNRPGSHRGIATGTAGHGLPGERSPFS